MAGLQIQPVAEAALDHSGEIADLLDQTAIKLRTQQQMAGGIASLKQWIKEPAPGFFQVPFPDGFRTPGYRFSDFLDSLEALELLPDQIAGIMLESYQGGSASFAPVEFIQSLREWSAAHQIQLIFDEVQAGFGRTGRGARTETGGCVAPHFGQTAGDRFKS